MSSGEEKVRYHVKVTGVSYTGCCLTSCHKAMKINSYIQDYWSAVVREKCSCFECASISWWKSRCPMKRLSANPKPDGRDTVKSMTGSRHKNPKKNLNKKHKVSFPSPITLWCHQSHPCDHVVVQLTSDCSQGTILDSFVTASRFHGASLPLKTCSIIVLAERVRHSRMYGTCCRMYCTMKILWSEFWDTFYSTVV